MNTKIVLVIVGIVIVAAGGYFLYTNPSSLGGAAAPTPEQGTEEVVQAQDTTVGTGEEAVPDSIVSVLYVGRLADGTVFDSSEAHGNEPLTFQLGTPGIIAGLQIGVNGMREGGDRVMAIPPAFGYGEEDVADQDGNVIIPANSTLIFEVTLLSVEPPPADAPQTSLE